MTGSSVSLAVAVGRVKKPAVFLARARDGVLLPGYADKNAALPVSDRPMPPDKRAAALAMVRKLVDR
jgi:hypothetical protein